MRIVLLFVVMLITGYASEKKSLCLNMIVKNEAQVIEKCLASVKPLIDYWVIVDTGSSDGTQQLIREFMKGIPGELHERAWVNFSHNRNEALALAKEKGDYLLLIDADEVLEFAPDFSLPPLEKDLYFIPLCQLGAAKVKRNGLLSTKVPWKWEGVLHETVNAPVPISTATLEGVVNVCNSHGENLSGRSLASQEEKYLRDAKTLEAALEKEPENSRYVYYLGVSYAAAKKYELAKKSFVKRVSMPSRDVEETYAALYNVGLMEEKLGQRGEAIQSFLDAHLFRPSRAEPLFQLAKLYRAQGNLPLGYIMAKYALTLPYPEGDLCVDYTVYDHNLLIEYANCALLLGKFAEGLDACQQLLANPHLPPHFRAPVESNRALAESKLSL